MPKGKGKGKGKKGPAEEPIETTRFQRKERERCMCPSLGNAYNIMLKGDAVRMETAIYRLLRCIEKGESHLDFSDCNLQRLPLEMDVGPEGKTARKYEEEKIDISNEASLTDEHQRMIMYGKELVNLITSVDLSSNYLFNDEDIFELLSKYKFIQKIILQKNYLNGIVSPSIGKINTIVELYLDDNEISEFPAEVSQWTQIKILSLRKNFLVTLPFECSLWNNLEYIDLRQNKIAFLPSSIGKWTELQVLLLGDNQIIDIPEDCKSFTKLKELNLYKNQLIEVPSSLEKMHSLEKLNLADNKINSFPGEIMVNLTKLSDLLLYKNKFTELPDEICELSMLKRLSISSTNIKSIPENVGMGCSLLEELYINNCPKFSSLPNSIGFCKRLREIQAKKCPAFKLMPSTSYEGMESLMELDVRAAKKQVCKLNPDMVLWLNQRGCKIRGGQIMKVKKGKK